MSDGSRSAQRRNPAEIDKTVSTRLGDGESAEQFAQRGRALDGLGVEQAIVLFTGSWTAARLAKVAAGRPLLDRVDRADRAG
jgi:hypothetical protein